MYFKANDKDTSTSHLHVFIRPSNPKELFNYRHSQLRNVIERTFGIWKKQFPILSSTSEYSFPTQVDKVISLAALYNFIKSKGEEDFDFSNNNDDSLNVPSLSIAEYSNESQDSYMKLQRDRIALQMWSDYIAGR